MYEDEQESREAPSVVPTGEQGGSCGGPVRIHGLNDRGSGGHGLLYRIPACEPAAEGKDFSGEMSSIRTLLPTQRGADL